MTTVTCAYIKNVFFLEIHPPYKVVCLFLPENIFFYDGASASFSFYLRLERQWALANSFIISYHLNLLIGWIENTCSRISCSQISPPHLPRPHVGGLSWHLVENEDGDEDDGGDVNLYILKRDKMGRCSKEKISKISQFCIFRCETTMKTQISPKSQKETTWKTWIISKGTTWSYWVRPRRPVRQLQKLAGGSHLIRPEQVVFLFAFYICLCCCFLYLRFIFAVFYICRTEQFVVIHHHHCPHH